MFSYLSLIVALLQLTISTSVPNNEGEPQPSQSTYDEVGGHRSSGRRSVRLFGHDIEALSPPPVQQMVALDLLSSPKEANRPPLIPRQPGAHLEPFRNLEMEDPNPPEPPAQDEQNQDVPESSNARRRRGPPTAIDRHSYMEGISRKFRFGVLDPYRQTIQTVSIFRGHGPEYYIGNGLNERLIRKKINERWPPGQRLNAREKYEKAMTEKTVEVSQKAMTFLLKSETNGIVHEPTGKVYMNTGAAGNTGEGPIKDIFEQWKIAALPKLRYARDRIHFKQSWQKKYARRKHNEVELEPGEEREVIPGMSAKKVEMETSSEEEEPDQEQTSIRRRKPRVRAQYRSTREEIPIEPEEPQEDIVEPSIRRSRSRS